MKDHILLWKSGHVLLPLWFFFFNILSQQQHINKQIRYSVGTLCLMGNQFMEFFTHILHKTKWYIK